MKVNIKPDPAEEVPSGQQGYPVVIQPGPARGSTPSYPRLGKVLAVRLPAELHKRIESQARMAGLTNSGYVRLAFSRRDAQLLQVRLLAHISRALAVVSEATNKPVDVVPLLVSIERSVKAIQTADSEGSK